MVARASEEAAFDPTTLARLEPFALLLATNPFEPAWHTLHRTIAGEGSHGWGPVSLIKPEDREGWSRSPGPWSPLNPIRRVLSETLLPAAAWIAQTGYSLSPAERAAYVGAAVYLSWDTFGEDLQAIIDADAVEIPFLSKYLALHERLFVQPRVKGPEAGHLLALLYQARRAFWFLATKIRGGSALVAGVRSALWRTLMTANVCTYADGTYRRMDEFPVLITGATGTGKEEAAECVGWSRYIPVDLEGKRFASRYAADYHARNLCEVPRDLVESALFGHKRGAFTGAVTDSPGYFGLASEGGTLFLDEIGELPEHVQAKLLRPLEAREYLRLGEVHPRKVHGRLVFATLRDLEALCAEGKFRADLLERMNGLIIHMPSLCDILAQEPGELRGYVRWFVADLVTEPAHVWEWTEHIVARIQQTRARHPWRRNLRELRNYTHRIVLEEGTPKKQTSATAGSTGASPVAAAGEGQRRTPATQRVPESIMQPSSGLLGRNAKEGLATADEVIKSLVNRMYVITGFSKRETARRTGLNFRTVAALIDPEMVARFVEEMQQKKAPPRET